MSATHQLMLDNYLCMIEVLNERIKSVNQVVRAWEKDDPRMKLLTSMPGVGIYSAAVIIAEIGEIHRFVGPKQLCSYAGLGAFFFCGIDQNIISHHHRSPSKSPETTDSARVASEHIPTDILVQLRTLADDTCLRILELLFEEGELFAQEIVTRLKLSKSSGSRHLSQLSAAGYLVEYQRAGKTKSYTLNPDSFRETLAFLERYAKA